MFQKIGFFDNKNVLFLQSKKLLQKTFFQKNASKPIKNLYTKDYSEQNFFTNNESDVKMVKNLYTTKIDCFPKMVLELLLAARLF